MYISCIYAYTYVYWSNSCYSIGINLVPRVGRTCGTPQKRPGVCASQRRLAGGSSPLSSCNHQHGCSGTLLLSLRPELDSADEDAYSRPALGAAIKALQAAFWDRDGPPVVVFDGLHAEDLPASEQVHKAVASFLACIHQHQP